METRLLPTAEAEFLLKNGLQKLFPTKSEEKTSTWSGVLGFFTDWAGVGKALLDMGSITDEAKQEVQLRKDYMLSIVTSLELSIEKYCMEIENDIKRNYHMNQKEFKEYVFKNF